MEQLTVGGNAMLDASADRITFSLISNCNCKYFEKRPWKFYISGGLLHATGQNVQFRRIIKLYGKIGAGELTDV